MPSSLNTPPAPDVVVEITSGSILMSLATALGADSQNVVHVAALLKQGTTYNRKERIVEITTSVSHMIAPLCSLPTSQSGLQNTLSVLKIVYPYDADIPLPETNLSSPTMTNKEPLSAYKPVTLTLTGQLKPNTITKVQRKKSSPSSKVVPQGVWSPNTMTMIQSWS